jgi:hypothetical protein
MMAMYFWKKSPCGPILLGGCYHRRAQEGGREPSPPIAAGREPWWSGFEKAVSVAC